MSLWSFYKLSQYDTFDMYLTSKNDGMGLKVLSIDKSLGRMKLREILECISKGIYKCGSCKKWRISHNDVCNEYSCGQYQKLFAPSLDMLISLDESGYYHLTYPHRGKKVQCIFSTVELIYLKIFLATQWENYENYVEDCNYCYLHSNDNLVEVPSELYEEGLRNGVVAYSKIKPFDNLFINLKNNLTTLETITRYTKNKNSFVSDRMAEMLRDYVINSDNTGAGVESIILNIIMIMKKVMKINDERFTTFVVEQIERGLKVSHTDLILEKIENACESARQTFQYLSSISDTTESTRLMDKFYIDLEKMVSE